MLMPADSNAVWTKELAGTGTSTLSANSSVNAESIAWRYPGKCQTGPVW